ncbi:MAG: hypothetical protein ACRD4P_01220 [Bryobacteraceae bacterium]
MTTSGTVLDLIEAFRRSKTMFPAIELGIFDGKHPPIARELPRLLEKQQHEYVSMPKPVKPNHKAFRATMFAAVELGIFDDKHPADCKELLCLLEKQQDEYVSAPNPERRKH